MKRTLLFLAVVIASISNVSAFDVEINGIAYNKLLEADKTLEVTYHIPAPDSWSKPVGDYSGDVVIPSTVTIDGTDWTVIAIGDNAFSSSTVNSLTIPNTVTTVGQQAFYKLGLTELTLPEGITSIGYQAFYMSTVEKLTLPASLEMLDSYAFSFCKQLEAIDMSATKLIELKDYTFNQCWALTDLLLPKNLTTLGRYVFNTCKELKNIEIPASVTSIGENLFSGCTALENVDINAKIGIFS